jgi:hypothetical protein
MRAAVVAHLTDRSDMTTRNDTLRFIAVNRVKEGKEQEFETFLRDTVAPAVEQRRPHQTDMWEVLRPAQNQDSDGTAAYIFLFYGDAPLDDWELDRLFTEAYGDEEATRIGEQWSQLLDGEQDIHYLSGVLPMK